VGGQAKAVRRVRLALMGATAALMVVPLAVLTGEMLAARKGLLR
jgi:hypothetical protein